MMKYGLFNDRGEEFIITDPKTPRIFDNFIWNESIYGNVFQTGAGYTDYQIGNTEMTKLTTGIGRICDFDVFGRDTFMNRLIYIRDNKTGEYWNLGWEPVKKEYTLFRCRHGLGYSIIENETSGIFGEFKLFVPVGKDAVELWTINLKNKGNENRDLTVFLYNQISFKYMWGFNSYGDMIYRHSYFNEAENMMVFEKHPYVSPHEFQTGFLAADTKISGYDGSKDSFVGLYNMLNEPEAVIEGKCKNSSGSADSTIAAVQFDIILDGSESKTVNVVFGVSSDINNCTNLKNKYITSIQEEFHKLKEVKKQMTNINRLETPDDIMNTYANNWNKQQALFGATWCRWGWMGYRDIVQHGYGISNFEPARTREIILEALSYQYDSGLALRGWNPVDTKPYSDSALWLIFTLTAYLKETGDKGIMDIKVPFYDGEPAAVIEHIDRALNFLENNKGSHHLVLIKYGDWNDSLTGIGKDGKGESVWLSMAYAYALKLMSELAESFKWIDKSADYLNRYNSMIEAINTHAWDGKWYLRGYCDDGTPIGSQQNEEGKIYINAQSWAIICGAAKGERIDELIAAVDEYLDTDCGYRLMYPTYTKFDKRIGRLTSMEPGIAENGTIYTHGNAFMLKALYSVGKADEAYKLYKKVSPGYLNDEQSIKSHNPSYVYANCYYGPDHRNNPYQMEFAWVTGSVAWMYNVLFDGVLGIERDYSGLKVNVHLPSEWSELKATRNIRGKIINIKIHRREDQSPKCIFLNGDIVEGCIISYEMLQQTNYLEIIV